MVEITVPGKLFLMGEYGVVKGHTGAILLPTKRTLTVTMKESSIWQFESDLEGSFFATDYDTFYASAFTSLKKLLRNFQETLPWDGPYGFKVTSELDDTHHAFGLGSSGAFTVAMVQAAHTLLKNPLNPFELFQRSALIQNDLTSSYGDLAVSAYQQSLYYHRPENLFENFDQVTIRPLPLDLNYHVIHSNQKVKSEPLIEAFFSQIDTDEVREYLTNTHALIEAFIDHPRLEIIEKASEAYLKLGTFLDSGMISPSLKDLLNLILKSGGTGKISGAGGGDNVLAFYPHLDDLTRTKNGFAPYIIL